MTIDKQALWEEFRCMQDHYSDPADRERQEIYIAAEALLDENIQLQREKDAIEAVALALRDDMRQAREQLEAAERRNAELDKRLIEYAGIATREAHRVAELERANAAQDDHINQQQDRIDALEKCNAELGKYVGELERYRTAYMEWSDRLAAAVGINVEAE